VRGIALRIAAAVLLAVLVYSIPSLLIVHEAPRVKAAYTPTTTAAKPKIAVEGATETLAPAATVSETTLGRGGGEAATYSVERAEAGVGGLLFNIPIAAVLAFAAAFTASRLRQR